MSINYSVKLTINNNNNNNCPGTVVEGKKINLTKKKKKKNRYPTGKAISDSKGKDVDLSIYKGKVLLIVNVASKCGFTDSNYSQLTDLYNKYKHKGLEILAFPCNQFLKQEPGTSQEAHEFACTRYKAEYPIFQKVRVNGPNAEPLYKFLKASKTGYFGSRIKWNFTKFLVDTEGNVIGRYSPTTSPMAIEGDIKNALGDV
ncbi:putative glutathione peroxidase 4 [Citrus sinensis]|nr:putative glutathione peroxidase 4 [Citrus sinensis]